MANIELLMEPHTSPFYIDANNIIYAATTITNTEINEKLYQIGTSVYGVLKIFFHTFNFIIHQLFKEMYDYLNNNHITPEKIVFFIVIYGLLFILNKIINKLGEQREMINSLQKQIQLLELVRNDTNEVWTYEIKNFMNQTNIKYSNLDKKTKKIEKELKTFD